MRGIKKEVKVVIVSLFAFILALTTMFSGINFVSAEETVPADEPGVTVDADYVVNDDPYEATVSIKAEPKEGYSIKSITFNGETKECSEASFIATENGEYAISVAYVEGMVENTSVPETTPATEVLPDGEAIDEDYSFDTQTVETQEELTETSKEESDETGFILFYNVNAEEEQTVLFEETTIEVTGIEEEGTFIPENTDETILEKAEETLDALLVKDETKTNEFGFDVYHAEYNDPEVQEAMSEDYFAYGFIVGSKAEFTGWYILTPTNSFVFSFKSEDHGEEIELAADWSSAMHINSWSILDSSNNPLSATNMAVAGTGYKLTFNWNLNLPLGNTLADLDTMTIPLPTGNTISFYGQTGAWENFTRPGSPIVIGQWRVNQLNNSIEIVFNSNAAGATSITGVDFTTGANALKEYSVSAVDIIETVTFGDGTATTIRFKGSPLSPETWGADVLKYPGQISNSVIEWGGDVNTALGHALANGAYANWGTNNTYIKNDAYLEDTFQEKGKYVDGSFKIIAQIYIPASLSMTDGRVSGVYWMTWDVPFIQKTPLPTDSYTSFKASLGQMEYGIFTESDGTQKLVAYFGSIGNNGLHYYDLDPNWIQNTVDRFATSGYFPDTPANRTFLTNYITKVYGNNVLTGTVAQYHFGYKTEYDKVVYNKPVSNTINLTTSGGDYHFGTSGTLQGIFGDVLVNSLFARCYKADVDTADIIPGATIKIQQSLDSGLTWTDYGVPSITNATGFVEYGPLPAADYRFVETTAAAGYDLATSPGYVAGLGVVSESFTVAVGEPDGHKVTIYNKMPDYRVSYDWGTDFPSDKVLPTDTNTYPTTALAEASKDTTFTSTSTSTAQKAGVDGTWHFSGWDNGTWTGTNLVYVGSWRFVPSIDITGQQVTKTFDTVNGQTPPTNETFTFTISPIGGAPAVGSPTSVTTVGAVTSSAFGDFTFTEAGTFSYEIKETNSGVAGYTYDSSVYTITYKVSESSNTLSVDAGYPTITKLTGGVTTTETSIAFENKYTPTPLNQTGLTVTKGFDTSVINDVAGITPPNPQKTFTFTITPQGTAPIVAAPTSVTTSGAGTSSAFGNMSFTTAGTYTYKIQETAGSDTGYTYDSSVYTITYKVSDVNGAITLDTGYPKIEKEEGGVTTTNLTSVNFTNRYVPNALTTTGPNVTKQFDTVNGQTPPTNKTFTFTITPQGTAPIVAAPTSVTTSGAGTSSAFGNITFTVAGTYTYNVQETNSGDTGYTYDSKVYTITYKVSDVAGSLTMDAGYPKYNDGTNDQTVITFENRYIPTPLDEIAPTVTKSFDLTNGGQVPTTNKTFTFVITPGTDGLGGTSPTVAAPTTVTTSGAEVSGNFGTIHFTKADTYTYTVTETAGIDPGYTYDSRTYTITYKISDVNGALTLDAGYPKYNNGTVDTTLIEFKNKYIPTPVQVDPPVEKNVTGADAPAGQTFKFNLEAVSTDVIGMTPSTMPMPTGATSGLLSLNFTAGPHEFGLITFSQPGVYTYKITETNESVAGFTYDTTVYEIEVTVTDNNSILEAVKKVTKTINGVSTISNFADGVAITGVTFTNSYVKPVTPSSGITPQGRTCQDDGYPEGYYWDENKQACVIGYKVPNTSVNDNVSFYFVTEIIALLLLGFSIKKRYVKSK